VKAAHATRTETVVSAEETKMRLSKQLLALGVSMLSLLVPGFAAGW
jgi:hypothetical protein